MKKIYFTILLTIAFVALYNRAFATTYYVAPSGLDTNSGLTTGTAFKTIQKAANTVVAGDTVTVMDGTYQPGASELSNSSMVLLNTTGTAGNPITFQAQNKWKAVIDGNNNSIAYGFNLNNSVSYINISGFQMQNISSTSITLGSNDNNVSITNNYIHDTGNICYSGAFGLVGIFSHPATNQTIEGNVIAHTGRYLTGENGCANGGPTSNDHGIYWDGVTNGVIKNNILYNNDRGYDIQIYGEGVGGATSSNLLIANNTIIGNSTTYRSGLIILGSPEVDDAMIVNNVFKNTNVAGINFEVAESPVYKRITVANNIISNGTTTTGTTTNITWSNNQVNTDPLIVASSTIDFQFPFFSLQKGSPAIDAGLSTTTVTNDILSIYRPQGAGIDIGAYETPVTEFSISGNVSFSGNVSLW